MRRLAASALATVAALGCIAAAPAFDWGLGLGIKPPPVPADNPMSPAKVELGRRLFYDADLSTDGTLSCSSCHVQRHAFANTAPTFAGVKGAAGRRNAPGLANVGYFSPLTLADPAVKTLEQQVAVPVAGEHPVEMGMGGQEAEIVRRLSADPCYRSLFAAAFPRSDGEITFAATARALAAFERTLVSRDTPFDRFRRGEPGTLSAQAQQGWALFQARSCAGCHSGPDFTDLRYHAIALEPKAEAADLGLAEKTGRAADRRQFRTPSLRNVGETAPYMHDGAVRTLPVAILAHERLSTRLSQDDVVAIAAFLESLTDQAFLHDPRFALPRENCGKVRVN